MPQDTELSAVSTVEHALPLCGPYSGDRTVAAAQVASAALRYQCHATYEPSSCPWPSTVSSVTAELRTMAAQQGQLLHQLAQQLQRHVQNPNVYADDMSHGATPEQLAAQYTKAVDAGRIALNILDGALRDAHNAVARLGIREPDEVAEVADLNQPDSFLPETGRLYRFEGGPWDGQTYWYPEWPPPVESMCQPHSPAGQPGTGNWATDDHIFVAAEPRYVPGIWDGNHHVMVWRQPDTHASDA